ncbi:MAG: hypothetical protein ISR99_00605 [Parcubacteria group bacterium]|nr:hypothetical protein [Parcubacteria group bacterium]
MDQSIKIPKAPLARTREHHVAIGSSGGSKNTDEYQKTAAELMNDDELRAYMEKELQTVREEQAKLGKERKGHADMFRMIRDKFLMANLRYLAEVGRLPDGFNIEAIEEELKVPEGIE